RGGKKGFGKARGKSQGYAEEAGAARQIVHDVLALSRLLQRVIAKRFVEGAEEERPPAHAAPVPRRNRADPRTREVSVGRAEIEVEIDVGGHRRPSERREGRMGESGHPQAVRTGKGGMQPVAPQRAG